MGRISNSWSVFKQSVEVLKKDKELLVLPVLSALSSIAIVATFMFPAFVSGLFERAYQSDPNDANAQYTLYALYLLMYLLLSFITIYFQAALISAANERLSGGDPTIGSALGGANKHLGKIFLWSLFAATVSLLIHAIQSALRGKNDILGRIIGSMLGTAWALATYFVIPVLLFEEGGTFQSLRRSGNLFKQRWGESLVGQFGIGLAVGLLTLPGILLVIAFGYVLRGAGAYVLIALVTVGVLWILFMTILGQALGGIYKTALYKYAKGGEVVPGFQAETIKGAYRPTYVSADRM